MRRSFFFFWFAIALPTLAQAYDVPVRSGEHDDFTRLVLSIGVNRGWEVTHNGQDVEVKLSDPGAEFQTETVFDRIPRTRIADIQTTEEGSLSLRLSCDGCQPDAFIWRPGELVVDIVERPPTTELPETEPTQTDAEPLAQTILARAPDRAPANSVEEIDPATFFDRQLERAVANAPTQTLIDENALLQSIARAASQGVLDVSAESADEIIGQLTSTETNPQESQGLVSENTSTNEQFMPSLHYDSPGISVDTAMEQGLSSIGSAITSMAVERCLTPSTFAVSQWGTDEPFAIQIAALHSDLVGEFDETNTQNILRLVRGYLYFGFGAEARIWLEQLDQNSQEQAVLLELAEIIEGGPTAAPIIQTQEGCENGAGPWMLIAGHEPTHTVDYDAVMRNFKLLPPTLQAQVAPRIASVFMELEDYDRANLALKSVEGTDFETASATQEVRSELAERQGHMPEAISLLEKQAEDDARVSPSAVIRLIDLAVSEGRSPREEDLVLAQTLRFENRDTPIAALLAIAEARGQAQNNHFSDAFDLIKQYESELPSGTGTALNSEFTQDLSQRSDDVTFLKFAFDGLPSGISEQAKNVVAKRLIELNFPDQALTILSGTAQREDMTERRYLRAEAALVLGDYEASLSHIHAISDQRANAIRVKAYEGLGNLDDAFRSAAPGQVDETLLAFRADAWERLSASDDTLLSEVARDRLSQPAEAPLTSLAERSDVIAQSIETRQRVDALLERFSLLEDNAK